jgi:hypothetical protein
MSVASTVAILLLASGVFAAPPDLPADALGDDVVGVLWIDAVQADPADFTAAIGASMGKYARPIADAMAPYTRLHAPFRRAGGTSMAIVYFDPYSANSATRGVANPVYLFSMTDPANRAAIESIVTTATADEVTKKSTAKFRMMGNWLIAYDGSLAEPYMEKGDPGRAKAIRGALRPIADYPATLAFVPTKRLRAAHAGKIGLDRETPRELNPYIAFVGALLECESLNISLKLGKDPRAVASMRFADAESAGELAGLRQPMIEALAAFMRGKSNKRIEQITQFSSYLSVFTNNVPQHEGTELSAAAAGTVLTRTAEGIGDGLALAREEALVVRSLNQMKALIIALNGYAQDHRGEYPESLAALKDNNFVQDFDKLIVNPRTGENPGYIYVRPATTIYKLVKANRTASTPLLYESRGGRKDPRGLIGYANASVERGDLPE